MPSDSERHQEAQNWLRVVQTQMDALGWSLEQALDAAPERVRDPIRAEIAAQAEVRFHRPGAVIRKGGPKDWFQDWDPAEGYLWRRLRSYLIDRKGWSLKDVDSLDGSSDSVLKHLEDPRTDGLHSKTSFRIQGLVLGYVQSGKTANFTSLIAKSADRGYRLIIVLSGIHNSLRAQTQRRLDLELGLIPDPKGVGLPGPGHGWWRITSSEPTGDFKPGTDAGPLAQGSRGVMVVKKNATVLRRLVSWLEDRVPPDLPVLVIDDEADQASINTAPPIEEVDLGPDTGDVPAEKELDASTINGLIRDLIDQFRRVSYVAYTATPFANVLIDPDVESDRHGSDLFPGDFIVSLPRPSAYIGAERVFGRPALSAEDEMVIGMDVVRLVPDGEVVQLVPKGKAAAAGWRPVVTPSLESALIDWLLATAAKVRRLGDGISSMLIHTTQKIALQNDLAECVEDHLRHVRNAWRYDPDSIRPAFIERWNSDFRRVTAGLDAALDVPFHDIEPFLNELLRVQESMRVLVLNSSSPDVLDYEGEPELKVVLVGGNRLSRGLTLEDLTVSFYVREANTYDTLLQMGRWFGYREEFVDLTRLWTTGELVSRFRHLSLVEEDLRDQIAIYERELLAPRDVAPKIRAHPAMLVTAKNRMGTAQSVRQSYAGELLQTIRFRLGNDEWLQQNLERTRELLTSLGKPGVAPRGDQRPVWGDVPWQYVAGYLRQFRTAQDAISFDADTAAAYIARQAESHQELTTWTVALRCANEFDEKLKAWDLGIEGFAEVNAINRSRLGTDNGSIGALASPPRKGNLGAGDETVDLTAAQVQGATDTVDGFPTMGHAVRWQRPRDRGLLMIFPISPFSTPGKNARDRVDLFEHAAGRPLVVGIALSFPPSDTGATVEYVSGKQSSNSIFASDDE